MTDHTPPVDPTAAIEVFARLLCAADVHVHGDQHPTWQQLSTEPGRSVQEHYREAARWLLPRMTVTATPAAEPIDTSEDRCAVCGHFRGAHVEAEEPVSVGRCTVCADEDEWHDFEAAETEQLREATPILSTDRIWQVQVQRRNGSWVDHTPATIHGSEAQAEYEQAVASTGHLWSYRLVCSDRTHTVTAQHNRPEGA